MEVAGQKGRQSTGIDYPGQARRRVNPSCNRLSPARKHSKFLRRSVSASECCMPPPTWARRLLPDVRGLPRPFWVLFAGTLVNRIGGFVLVFLAIYLTEVRGLTATEAGAILSAYGLGAIGGGPVGGALSDRIGRRPTLVVSLIGGGVSMLVLGLVTRTVRMTVAAVVTGLLYEMYRPVVAATFADVVCIDDRPRAYGLIYWAVNVGASVLRRTAD